MALRTITPPTTEPLTLTELKQALRVDYDADDSILTALIVSAREWCEDYQKKKYITQTLELVLDGFADTIEFRACSPVQSVASVKYYDTAGNESTVDSATYQLDKDSIFARLEPCKNKQWPSISLQKMNGVVIRFVAGYGDNTQVPESVKQAIILHIKTLYEDYKPDEIKRIQEARNSLLGMKRVINV